MEVTITHSGVANNVQVSASVPGIVNVVPGVPIQIEVQLFRDGKNGKSAYEIAVENGFLGSEVDFANNIQNISQIDLLLNYNIAKL